MRKLFTALISAILCTAGTAAAAPPAELEIAYQVSRDGAVIADSVHRLRHSGGAYELTETWKGRGLYALRGQIKRHSQGKVVATGLKPLEYVDERSGRRTERASFDWNAGTVTLLFKGPARVLTLPRHPSDRLAFFYEFAFDPPLGEQVEIDVIDGRGISDQVYRNAGRERLKTPAGEFDALRLVRHKENNERAELWLAADRSYIPVRVLVVAKDGSRLEQVATRISVP